MRITSLKLTDFRSYNRASLTLDAPITFLCGRNGVGKSSALDAIAWALTGRCRGTDGRGAGASQLKRGDAPTLSVSVELEGLGTVTRTLAGSQTLTVRDDIAHPAAPVIVAQAALLHRLGVSEGVLAAVLQGDTLLQLPHAEAKALLMTILDVRVPLEGEPAPLTLAALDARYQQAFDARKTAKAHAAAIQVPEPPDGEPPVIADIERRLAELRARETQLRVSEATQDGSRQEQRRQLEIEASRLRQRRSTFDEAEKTQVLASPAILTEFDASIAQLTATLAADDEAAPSRQASLVAADGRLTLLSTTLTSLQAHTPDRGCVLDAAVPCKTPAKYFKTHLQQLQHEIDRLAEETRDVRTAVAARVDHVQALRLAEDGARRVRAELARRDERGAQRQEFEARLTAIAAELAALPIDAPPAPSPELADVVARIAKGDDVLAKARRLSDALAVYQERLSAKTAALKEVGRLEALVEQLGPKGVRVAALAGALERFQEPLNVSLAAWGYAVRFALEPWGIVVNGRSAELLSTSERLRVGVALQLAIATVTGLYLVVIDQVDLLDGPNRAVLTELLASWPGQVLLAATKDAPPPAMDGIAVYWLEATPQGTRVERVSDLVAVA